MFRKKSRSIFSYVSSFVLLALAGYATQPAHADEDNGNGLVSSGISAFSAPSIFGPVTTGGPWFEFSFGKTGIFAIGCYPADLYGPFCGPSSGGNSVFASAPPWTFNATSWRKLTVTDAFSVGDQFEVYDSGISIGITPLVPVDGTNCGSDPDVCVAMPNVSHRVFVVGPGDHEINIQVIFSFAGAGAAYFRVDRFEFAGAPGEANCLGMSVSNLAQTFGGLDAAAKELGLPSATALEDTVKEYCRN
jgi:hypothetical protein